MPHYLSHAAPRHRWRGAFVIGGAGLRQTTIFPTTSWVPTAWCLRYRRRCPTPNNDFCHYSAYLPDCEICVRVWIVTHDGAGPLLSAALAHAKQRFLPLQRVSAWLLNMRASMNCDPRRRDIWRCEFTGRYMDWMTSFALRLVRLISIPLTSDGKVLFLVPVKYSMLHVSHNIWVQLSLIQMLWDTLYIVKRFTRYKLK